MQATLFDDGQRKRKEHRMGEKKSRTPKGPKVQIDVTEEIIEQSMKKGRRDSRHCMMADALRAAYPDARAISVDLATIRFSDPKRGLRFTYMTPRIGQVELVKFDQGVKPKPYSFQLRAPQVSRSGSNRTPKLMTAEERRKRSAQGHRLNATLRKQGLRKDENAGTVLRRVGGRTPPLQVDDANIPFSRRRAFGLRALEY